LELREVAALGGAFPSIGFLESLRSRMQVRHERFERLGYVDVTFGLRVVDTGREYTLDFEVFECSGIREGIDPKKVDFVLEASSSVWQEMFANIRSKGRADSEHGINTLTHFGDSMRAVYDDPDGHDKLFRFAESIQEFFDLAGELDDGGAASVAGEV
jgi:hypothetical protein